MGIGPACIQIEDRICGFLGGQMLYAVRKTDVLEHSQDVDTSCAAFIGECYVHGLMDSQALRYNDDGMVQSKRITLR